MLTEGNTFTAWISQQVPELALELPFSAIGSGYTGKHGKSRNIPNKNLQTPAGERQRLPD